MLIICRVMSIRNAIYFSKGSARVPLKVPHPWWLVNQNNSGCGPFFLQLESGGWYSYAGHGGAVARGDPSLPEMRRIDDGRRERHQH